MYLHKKTYEFPPNAQVRRSESLNSDQYLCCCQLIHVKIGAYIIGVIECVGLLLQLLVVLAETWEKGEVSGEFWITMPCLCFFSLVVVSLFASIRCHLPSLLIVHLAMQVIAIVMVGMASVLIVVLILLNATDTLSNLFINDEMTHKPKEHSILLMSGLMAFCYAFATGLEIWFLLVVWRCYRFLRHESDVGKLTFQLHALTEH